MDNTPLHPDITTLPPDTGQRHGDFLTAIPYNRSMYRTTLLLRLASMLDAVIILASLASQKEDDAFITDNWSFGCPTAVLALLWSAGDNGGGSLDGIDPRQTHTMAAVIFFMFVLVMIHFALFIFAIVEVDNERRHYSDVVFIPRGELCEMVPVPPSTPWEMFSPRKLLLSYFANHYVRFVPGADGTVTVARDYSSRQARF
ncbi:hypothetical protein COL5a_004827 [Colletotrichum fioriniae]|nr:hypothetical protein COL5a_004827 [Colletotrichum fioriniae]